MSTNALLLHSQDGQGYAKIALYPIDWSDAKADDLASLAIAAARRADPDEYDWSDIRDELIARDFTVPLRQVTGPVWD